MMRGSLHQRLFLVVLLSVIPVSVVHLAILIASDIRTAAARAAAITQDIAAAALPLLQTTLVIGDLATSQETLDNVMRHGQFRSLRLLDPDGVRILAEGRTLAGTPAETVPDWFVRRLDFRFPAQRFPVEAGGTLYGSLVAEPSSVFLVAAIWRRIGTAVVLWLVALVLSLTLLKITLRRGLRALDDLAAAAHRFGEGDLNTRAPASDVPELAETAAAFNRMADNLHEAQERLEERVRQATRELEHLIACIPAGVYKLRVSPDDTMRFDYVSPRWCELLELDAAAVRHDPWAPLSRLDPGDVDGFIRQFDAAKAKLAPFTWEGRLREGLAARWLHVESVPTPLDGGDVLWEGIQYDITATKQREAELDRIAHYDALTGVPNRVLLTDRLHQAIARSHRSGTALAVCYLDLDGFKPVNDAFGHKAGDALLVAIAGRLLANVRGGDTVARIGGDEFVLLLAGMAGIDEYESTLNRILEVVNEPVDIESRRVAVSASIGIALYPKDDADPDLLLRHADQAMYEAKQAGRNKFIFFDPNLEDDARRHRELLRQIGHGIGAGEFELYYQPKVNMRHGAVVGFEALVRWNHPGKGLLLPKDFLPLIEDNDVVVDLGGWVIDQALLQLAVWRRQGLDFTVSVNIAPRHLQLEHFAERLRQCLEAHPEVPPGNLEIEIVETVALSDTARVAGLIGECRELGVSFALDDFGTGYSSLTYLKSLPARTLKIDQAFVRDMLVDANDLAIVEGVIDLTEIFRREVVAEGVESTEHGLLLLNMGCELAQGYGIARPMPAGAVAEWLDSWRPDPAWIGVQGSRWPREDVPLVIAQSNHRAWVDDLAAYLEGATAEMPELVGTRCRFGQWYGGAGELRYGRYPDFATIGSVHRQVHALARALVDLADRGQREAARARLPEMYGLRDRMLALLRQLMAAANAT
jgi:diguanylate cyclase (GGDEF)-like protein